MNIFKNKYFLLGNLAFLLLAIPVVLYFVKNQTSTRGSAAPTTTLSFVPNKVDTDQCDDTKTARLVVNPGENVVNQIDLVLKWDKTKFDINFAPNQSAFPQTIAGPEPTQTGMSITLNTGADVTKALTTTTDVGTVTIKPVAPTGDTFSSLDIDTAVTKVFSLSGNDGQTENVFNAAGSSPLQVTIAAKSCNGTQPSTTTSPSPTQAAQTSPSPSPSTTITPTLTPTPTTGVANKAPVCLNLTSSVSSGSAPLSVNFTATGNDTDGTLSKATFNLGNGTQQDVITGLGAASGSAQLSYTYTSGGTFTATAIFTDNGGAVSATCSQQIAVSGAVATVAPTATPTEVAMSPTESPTATPTIAATGSVSTTIGIVGGVILMVLAGVFLFVL